MTKIIPLTQGKVAKVSDVDYIKLSIHKWYFHKSDGYAVRKSKRFFGRQKLIYMHHEIIQSHGKLQIDHIDRNKLNNQRENLRVVTHSENKWNEDKQKHNRSGYKGVYWNNSRNKWIAQITIKGKQIYLGSFDDPIKAAKRYDDEVIKRRGRYAFTNFEK